MGRKFIYTDKHHTYTGIMSAVFGLIAMIALVTAVKKTYEIGGVATQRYAASCVLIFVFAFIGIILGFIGKNEEDRFYIFSYVGIAMNILTVLGISGLLYAGAYGL